MKTELRTPTEVTEAFLLSRRLNNCTEQTLHSYGDVLQLFCRGCSSFDSTEVQRYFAAVQAKVKPITAHKHYRTLRSFFNWAVEAGVLKENPLGFLKMKLPKTLPSAPEDADVSALLRAFNDAWHGRRNRALVALFADSAIRRFELARLRIEDISLANRTIRVRGKGQKDGIAYFGAQTAHYLRHWLAVRVGAYPEDLLFCKKDGAPLNIDYISHVLYRPCIRAGLARKWAPHSLRHYAATSILRQTGDLELVRQVLRHETLAMSLRYARLTGMDVSRKYRRASPLDNL